MCDSRKKTQLELVAVETPKSWNCTMPECDGKVYRAAGDLFPHCKTCKAPHWLAETIDDAPCEEPICDRDGQIAFLECESRADAQTIADFEAEVAAHDDERDERLARLQVKLDDVRGRYAADCVSHAETIETYVAECNGYRGLLVERADEIKTLKAEVKTLSETITMQAKQLVAFAVDPAPAPSADPPLKARMTLPLQVETYDDTVYLKTFEGGVVVKDAKYDLTVARLEYIRDAVNAYRKTKDTAPPADSREAFDEWAKKYGYGMSRLGESGLWAAWLAALESRGSKPKKIAETGDTFARTSDAGPDLIVLGGEVFLMHGDGVERAVHLINVACGCEEAKR